MNVPTTQRLLLFPCPLNKIIHMVAIMPNIALWGTMKPKQSKNQKRDLRGRIFLGFTP